MVEGLAYLTLFVTDLEKSVAFYRDALGLNEVHTSPHFVMLSLGNTKLGLHQGDVAGKAVNLHFQVNDVDAAYEILSRRGLSFTESPGDKPWGLRVASLRDPDGYRIELVTPLSG